MSCEFVLDMCRRKLAIFDKQTTRGFQRSKFRALIAAQRPYKSTRRHFMTNLTRKNMLTGWRYEEGEGDGGVRGAKVACLRGGRRWCSVLISGRFSLTRRWMQRCTIQPE